MPAISITALSDPVAIVHIPVNRSEDYATKLYWAICQASTHSAEFFNVTSNQVEIAIFASVDSVETAWQCDDPDVRVNSSWRVFEISSGDEGDTGNYDSPHLRMVSGPLARAGISILYQSSHYTDYLLCKETDFERAASIFVSQGWQVNEADPIPSRRRSGLYTPSHSTASASASTSIRSSSPRISPSPPPTPVPTSPEMTVLSSPLACVGFAKSAERACGERLRRYIVWPERALLEWEQQRLDLDPTYDGEVKRSSGRPFVSYTRTEDGTSLVTEVKALRGMFPAGDMEELDVQCAGELSCDEEGDFSDDDSDSDTDSEEGDIEEEYPVLSTSIDLQLGHDIQMTYPTIDQQSHGQAPPTPPLTASSTTSSPGKKRLSLPLSPLSDVEIPFSWSRTTRSMCTRLNQSVVHAPEEKKVRRNNGTKRCLQLDLRGVSSSAEEAYHLDKFGLVTLFSDLLDSAQIKMLYSSTFHTANILVEPEDVARARRLLKRGKM